MAAAWPALVGAADAWRAVLAFAQPPDWLRASAATASMLRAYRTERAELLRVNVPQASVESLIDGGEIGQLWCLLQTSPHLVNAPLEGHALTYPLHAAVDPLAPSSLRAATLLLHMRALVDNRDFDRESALHAAAALCLRPWCVCSCRACRTSTSGVGLARQSALRRARRRRERRQPAFGDRDGPRRSGTRWLHADLAGERGQPRHGCRSVRPSPLYGAVRVFLDS